MLAKVRRILSSLSLNQRFMLAGLVILLAGMLGIGAWVEQQIVTGVIHRTGATTALYVDSFVSPNLQELGQSGQLLPEHTEELNKLMQNTPIGQQIVAFKVWDTRGKLLYTTDQSIIGQTYPMHEGLLRARLGEVVSEVSRLEDVENQPLSVEYERLLETYSPVWQSGTNQIIAVAEFYQLTAELENEINILKQRSWLVVGMIILVMYLLLGGFVRRASDTITRQQDELGIRVEQLTDLLSQNRELHDRIRRAAASVTLLNERNLRRVGSELHDGPAQDLGLSLLKLDALVGRIEEHRQAVDNQAVITELTGIEASLQNALKEMRGIAAGLSLPQLKELDLAETVVRVVHTHERRTGSSVDLEIAPVAPGTALPLKITIYRLVQEALNNAYRHAGGAGQKVRLSCENDQFVVEISDTGSGFSTDQATGSGGQLGLGGMRERVESLGGRFHIESRIGEGTKIIARLPCVIDGGSAYE